LNDGTPVTPPAQPDDALSIFAAARDAPDAIGLRSDQGDFTFRELAALTGERLAAGDLRRGSGDVFALDCTASLETVLTLHALLAAGRPVLLLPPRLTASERQAAIAAAGRARRLPADAAAIVLTSGTSGPPKAAVLTRAALLASAAASAANLGWQADDCWLLAMPIARVGGLSVLTRCLAARRTVALAPGFYAATLPQRLERQRVTLASLVPTMLARLLDAHPRWQPPARLRAVLIGGDAASAPLLERAAARRVPIVITYGCTETCSQVVATPYARRYDAADCGAGAPLAGAEVRIERGHIQVRGAMRMAGYAGEAPLEPQDWFDTGDLGAFDAAGFLQLHGRSSELIITGGENVHPKEVEQVLEGFPGIAAAAVFGIADDTWGQMVAAALVTEGAVGDPALAAFLASRLAPHKWPRRIAVVPALPQTAGGKVDRGALASLARMARPLRFDGVIRDQTPGT